MPHILRNMKIHDIFTRPRPYPEPDKSTPCPPFHFLKIHFNVIFPSIPRSSKCALLPGFSHQISACTSPLHHTCHMVSPSYLPWFDQANNILWSAQIIIKTISLLCLLHSPVTSSLWGQDIILNVITLQHPQPMFPLQFVILKKFLTLRSTGMGRCVVLKVPIALSLFLWYRQHILPNYYT